MLPTFIAKQMMKKYEECVLACVCQTVVCTRTTICYSVPREYSSCPAIFERAQLELFFENMTASKQKKKQKRLPSSKKYEYILLLFAPHHSFEGDLKNITSLHPRYTPQTKTARDRPCFPVCNSLWDGDCGRRGSFPGGFCTEYIHPNSQNDFRTSPSSFQ